jgi:hypothetical protein
MVAYSGYFTSDDELHIIENATHNTFANYEFIMSLLPIILFVTNGIYQKTNDQFRRTH